MLKGNSNAHTPKKNFLPKPVYARYIRIIAESYSTHRTLRLELYGVPNVDPYNGCNKPLGMQSHGIDNSQISVSTETLSNREKYGKQSARLNYKYAWRAMKRPINEYLQVDLGFTRTITSISTQGDKEKDVFVEQYLLKYSDDGKVWKLFKSFKGNNNQNKFITHIFAKGLNTRYIKILPQIWEKDVAMRIELYGCDFAYCDNQPVGIGNGLISNSQFAASSLLNDATKANNGRLGFTGADSWCAGLDDNNAYLQIDLGVPHVLCAVATQGNSKADQIVTSYTIQTSENGKTWQDYKENNEIKTFHGNWKSNSIAKHVLDASPVLRFVRILPKSYIGAPCLRVELYGIERTSCNNAATGIGEPFYTIPDHRFTASSVHDHKYLPWKARTLNPFGWEPKDNKNNNDYLQIDLGAPHVLCAVGLQPNGQSFRLDERTLSYKMAFSMDGKTWIFYPKKELPGNKYPETHYPTVHISKNTFHQVQLAKLIRIYPVKYHVFKVIRTELYGVKQAWKQPLGLEKIEGKTKVADRRITASSSIDKTHSAVNARLYGGNSWCGKPKSYLLIDFVQNKHLAGLSVQGDEKLNKWVTELNLEYGYTVKDIRTLKKIPTHLSNAKEVKVYWLARPVGARFVRITPTKWKSAPCMRIELHVNDKPFPTLITDSYVIGNLTAQSGSYITAKCIASGDISVNIKWLLGSHDVTDKSHDDIYSDGKTFSELRVYFPSIPEVRSSYKCSEVARLRWKCKTVVTCLAERPGSNGDRKDHTIEVFLDLPEPTTKPTLSTTVLTKAPTNSPSPLPTVKPKLIHSNRKIIKKHKKKVETNPLKPEFWKVLFNSSAALQSTWIPVFSFTMGLLGMVCN